MLLTGSDLEACQDTSASRGGAASASPLACPLGTPLCGPGPARCQLTPRHWDWILRHEQIVLARTTPEQKLMVVSELQRRGHCVACVGDGVNDALAMRRSDVGIAMSSCSDLLREAADIVLLGDDLQALVEGVAAGRHAFLKLRQMFLYQMPAGCFAEVVAALSSAISGIVAPLSCFYMICLCMITDLIGAVSLGFASHDEDVMADPPRDVRKNRLLNWHMWAYSFLYIGALETTAAMGMFLHVWTLEGVTPPMLFSTWKWGVGDDIVYGFTTQQQMDIFRRGQSAFLVTLIVCQLFNLLTVSSLGKPWFLIDGRFNLVAGLRRAARWRYLIPTVANVGVALLLTQISTTSIPTQPCPPHIWGKAVAMGFAVFLVEEVRKWVWLGVSRLMCAGASAGQGATGSAGSAEAFRGGKHAQTIAGRDQPTIDVNAAMAASA